LSLVNIYQPTGKPAYGDFGIEELGRGGLEDFSRRILDAAAQPRCRQK
jgi:hypothetical protein